MLLTKANEWRMRDRGKTGRTENPTNRPNYPSSAVILSQFKLLALKTKTKQNSPCLCRQMKMPCYWFFFLLFFFGLFFVLFCGQVAIQFRRCFSKY